MTATIYRHLKRGTLYEVVGRARMQIGPEQLPQIKKLNVAQAACRCLERKTYVVYRSLDDGRLYVRPEQEFLDGRFVPMETSTGTHCPPVLSAGTGTMP